MRTLTLLVFFLCTLLLANSVSAQNTPSDAAQIVEKSPAVVVLASHRATLVSELNTLRSKFTETYHTVIRKKSELEITEREMVKILAMPKSQQMVLSEAYGKLVVRKITTETALVNLLRQYTLTSHRVLREANQLQAIEKELSDIWFK